MSETIAVDELFPVVTEQNAPYYEAIKEGKLSAQKCENCDNIFLPAAAYCPKCLSDRLHWTVLSGEGQVYSWVEYHHAYHEAFKEKLPYVVAIVELKEGARMIASMTDEETDQLRVGLPVQAVFTKGLGEYPIVQFQPI